MLPLADLYRAQGRFDLAFRLCERVLEGEPEHAEGYFVFGRVLYDTDDEQGAFEAWEIALDLDPEHLAARRAIALLALERDQLQEAEHHLRAALEHDPEDPRLRRALESVRRRAREAEDPERTRQPVLSESEFWAAVAPRVRAELDRFMEESGVQQLLVLDRAGRVIAQRGFPAGSDLGSLASLAIAAYAAAGEMARMMGQPPFSQRYLGSGSQQLFTGMMETPATSLLCLAILGMETNLGLVRSLFPDFARRLNEGPWPARKAPEGGAALEAELAASLDGVGGR